MIRTALAVAFALVAEPVFAQDKPRKVAFLVGVGKYDFNFRDLGKSPENDVTELAKVLKAGGFEVVILTSAGTGKDRATKANIDERFRAVLKGTDGKPAIKKGDTLLVSLCGHGIQAEALDPMTQKKEQPFFCPADAMPDDTATMVPLNGLIRAVEPHGATALFLVDACREVKDDNRSRTGIQGKKVVLPAKTAVLFACGQGQLSHQSDKVGHGLFTFAILKTVREDTVARKGLSWSQLVAGVEAVYQSSEFRTLLPADRTQSSVLATGELQFTPLLGPNYALEVALLEEQTFNSSPPGSKYFDEFGKSRIGEWKLAAEQGNVDAMILFGLSGILQEPLAVYLNPGLRSEGAKQCQLWLQRAIDKGSVAAKCCLALYMISHPNNVDKKPSTHLSMLREAADAGHGYAMYRLGMIYEYGEVFGLQNDLAEAKRWYSKAAAAGYRVATQPNPFLEKK